MVTRWRALATSTDRSHLKLSVRVICTLSSCSALTLEHGQYSDNASWGLVYNLYADKLLQLGLVPSKVYEAATTMYGNVLNTSLYGIATDSGDARVTSVCMCLLSSPCCVGC